MRSFITILLISLGGCGGPSYSLRASSATPLVAVNDSPPPAGELSTVPRTIVLVPAVRSGHSSMWKTGAIITFTSLGVTLAGAALTISGLGNLDYGYGGNDAMFWTGIAMSIVGDGGAFIAGPVTWMAGIGRDPQ